VGIPLVPSLGAGPLFYTQCDLRSCVPASWLLTCDFTSEPTSWSSVYSRWSLL